MSIRDKIKTAIQKWLIKIGVIEKDNPTPPVTPPVSQPVGNVPVGTDALPWESIHFQGGNHGTICQHALPNKVLRSATIVGNCVRLDGDSIQDWPPMTHDEGNGDTWQSYGRLCVFSDFIDGALRGNHADWLSSGQASGKVTKTIENVFNGYLFNPPPPRDARFWFALVSLDGRFRTNMVKGE